MFIQIQQTVKCSNCGAENNYESITRKKPNSQQTVLVCMKCNHESIESELYSIDFKRGVNSSNPTFSGFSNFELS